MRSRSAGSPRADGIAQRLAVKGPLHRLQGGPARRAGLAHFHMNDPVPQGLARAPRPISITSMTMKGGTSLRSESRKAALPGPRPSQS